MARVIVVTSGKGGVGKTTCTASIGAMLGYRGKRVLLIDADIGLNNLDVLVGIDDKVVYDMADVISGRCRVKQALVSSPDIPNMYVLPSQNAYNSDGISMKDFRGLIAKLSDGFDFIFIDCPAGIDKGFHRAVAPSSEALVIATPNVSSLRDADKVINILHNYKLSAINLIVNRMRGDMVLNGEMMSVMEISKILNVAPIGVIPDDDKIHIFTELGKIGKAECLAMRSFECVADNFITGRRRLYDPTAQYRGMVGKLKLMLKRA